MADIKISELTAVTSVAGTDLFEVSEDTGSSTFASKKATATQVQSFVLDSYAGGSTITTLGTVSTGTWNATVIAGQYGGTGVNNSGKTLTLGGNFATSGAYALTLTLTAATTLTLPTTGTLATLAGSETLSAKTLTNPTVTNYIETVYAPSAGTSFTVDLANGTIQKFTSNGNLAITLPSSVAGKSYLIVIAYGGAHTLSFSGGSTIKWAGGSAPTATSASGKFDIYSFWCDGTNTYGIQVGANF